MSLQERFDAHWLPDLRGDCWVWLGSLSESGHGRITTGSKIDGSKRPTPAHRVAYELHRGPIPAGAVIDHLCRNRWCVNPEHLEPVTSGENTRRGNAGRHMIESTIERTHCPQGHPYTGDNLYISRGARQCRICRRAASDRYKTRSKAPAEK